MYEKFKVIKTEKEFWDSWTAKQLDSVKDQDPHEIYNKYFVRCAVFQRDNFKCQNEECKTPHSLITMHHIKHQRNDGKTSLRNCITICEVCHGNFNSYKGGLTFNGMTYKLHKDHRISWKIIRAETKQIRKNVKEQHGVVISWQMLCMLLRWLEKPHNEIKE